MLTPFIERAKEEMNEFTRAMRAKGRRQPRVATRLERPFIASDFQKTLPSYGQFAQSSSGEFPFAFWPQRRT